MDWELGRTSYECGYIREGTRNRGARNWRDYGFCSYSRENQRREETMMAKCYLPCGYFVCHDRVTVWMECHICYMLYVEREMSSTKICGVPL